MEATLQSFALRAAYAARMSGTLYVVSTPIGNLEDLSARAARILATVELIAAENTRSAAKLLKDVAPNTRCVPYNDRNKARTTAGLLAHLADGQSLALITDAGAPSISDPGQDLVEAAVTAGVTVVPIPGPSAVTTLLSVAGHWGRQVSLHGFAPRRSGERRRLFTQIGERSEAALLFESPHRLRAMLADLEHSLPQARLVVGRELTKLHEEIWRGSASEAVDHFDAPRGEFVLLVIPPPATAPTWTDAKVGEALRGLRGAGKSRSAASAEVARETGRPKREVYALWPED